MFAKIENGAAARYPYPEDEIRADHPKVFMPSDLSGADLSDLGIVRVSLVDQPAAGADQVVEEAAPALVGGVWTQQWAVRALTAEELTARMPVEVSMRQARLALLGAGLLANVDAAIAALPSPQREQAQIEWEYATSVRRASQLVALLGVALGLDDAAIDALFVAAAQIA